RDLRLEAYELNILVDSNEEKEQEEPLVDPPYPTGLLPEPTTEPAPQPKPVEPAPEPEPTTPAGMTNEDKAFYQLMSLPAQKIEPPYNEQEAKPAQVEATQTEAPIDEAIQQETTLGETTLEEDVPEVVEVIELTEEMEKSDLEEVA